MKKLSGFEYFCATSLNLVLTDLKRKELENLCELVGLNLKEKLYECLLLETNTVVLESLIDYYHYLRSEGVINGENRDSRISYFEDLMSKEKNQSDFFNKYSILRSLLNTRINDLVNQMIDVMKSFFEDKESIEQNFDCKIGKLCNLKFSLGDLHDGKSVCLIEGEFKKIVYKPRNLMTDVLLKRLLLYINEYANSGLTFVFPKILSSEKYSWQEFIDDKPCESVEEAHNFHLKAGYYLAIFYILGSSDLHFENLVACGENPMFIDLETLINGPVSRDLENMNYRGAGNSVLRTAMLPLVDEATTFDVNVSALFTGENASKKIFSTMLTPDPDLDWVYVKQPYFTKATKNIVNVRGEIIKPEEFFDDVINGFKYASKVIIEKKEEIEKIVKDKVFDNMEIRELLRPTRVYDKFLQALHNPISLQDNASQEKILDILLDNFNAKKFGYLRAEKEVEALRNGYIPSFSMFFNDRNLYFNSDLVCENYFVETPNECIVKMLNAYNFDLMSYQIRIIRMSFSTLYKPDKMLSKQQNYILSEDKWNKEMILKISTDYVNSILKYIVPISESESSLEILHIDDHIININLLSPSIYEGGGLLLLIAYYDVINKVKLPESKKLLQYMLNQYREAKLTKEVDMNFSVFSGNGGLIYLCYNFYKLFGENLYLDYTKELIYDFINSLKDKPDYEGTFGYIDGIAGAVIMLCNIKKEHDNLFMEEVCFLGNIYYNNFDLSKIEEIGYAHGLSGIAVAFAKLYEITKDIKYLNKCEECLIKEHIAIDASKMSFSWCHGYAGLLLAYFQINSISHNHSRLSQFVKDRLNEYTNFNYHSYLKMDTACLCHGLYGNIEVLCITKNIFNVESEELLFKKYFNDIDDLKWLSYGKAEFDSFMLGTSGVLYTLNRLKTNIPSILCLDVFK